MFIIIYNIIFSICLIIAFPFLLIFLPKKELKPRLGFNEASDKGFYWFHCASVGEVNAVKPLIEALKTDNPQIKVLMTTMTLTGLENAKSCEFIEKATLLPFDLVLLYKIFIKNYQPECLIIIETELWFSLLYTCRLHKIPVMIVNGRISDKSYHKYRFISPIVKGLFRYVSFIGAQSEEHRKRYLSLGFTNVYNTHNLKFCTQLPAVNKYDKREQWYFQKDAFVLVWGSMREGEEELLLSIYRRLKREIPKLMIIIAPRHLNRLPKLEEFFSKRKYSLLSQRTSYKDESDIVILDTMGKLVEAYAITDVAIVGGSFIDYGGHNPLEPLFYETATIIGHFHSSCRDLVEILLDKSGIIVSNKKRLVHDVLRLAENKDLRNNYGRKGKQTIIENGCSVRRNISLIKKSLT